MRHKFIKGKWFILLNINVLICKCKSEGDFFYADITAKKRGRARGNIRRKKEGLIFCSCCLQPQPSGLKASGLKASAGGSKLGVQGRYLLLV
jgi:hypothetical protein